ncbi:hypothetical protein FGO68_gene6299 [Halteria grandinella]|uniref:Uncharacterized protein n=1 Tax=Halteria grandinella TaxID=5974 RepID=A0A8J8NQE7_HALGN|nr:hypothetical protein FGO68_gene6299 [Halteria grandinella]
MCRFDYQPRSKCGRCLNGFTLFLKRISIGKHNQGLYFDGRRHYSTVFGGLFTLLIIFLMLVFTISTIKSIANREQYQINYTLKTLESQQAMDGEMPDISEMELAWNKHYALYLDPQYHESCKEVGIIARLNSTKHDGVVIEKEFDFDVFSSYSPLMCIFRTRFDYDDMFGVETVFEKWIKTQKGHPSFMYNTEVSFGYYVLEMEFKTRTPSKPLALRQALLSYKTANIGQQSGKSRVRDMTVDLLNGRETSKKGAQVVIEFHIEEYYNTDSVFDIGFLTGGEDSTEGMAKDYVFSSDFNLYAAEDDLGSNDTFKVKYGMGPMTEVYVRKPVSLVQGLAKIGGFLGFLKIFSLLLALMHEILFERNLSKATKPPKNLKDNLSDEAQKSFAGEEVTEPLNRNGINQSTHMKDSELFHRETTNNEQLLKPAEFDPEFPKSLDSASENKRPMSLRLIEDYREMYSYQSFNQIMQREKDTRDFIKQVVHSEVMKERAVVEELRREVRELQEVIKGCKQE